MMPSYQTPKKNTAFIMYVGLVSQADPRLIQSNPTIAAGDFKVSIDGGSLANLTTLPAVTPGSSRMVKISLSADEMNGDNITVVCADAAGAEWCDQVINIQTSVRQIDDLAWPTTSGRSMDVDASGGVEVGSFQTGAITADAIATDALGALELAAGAASEIATAVMASVVETGYDVTSILKLVAAACAGKASGAETTSIVYRNVLDTKNRISATVDSYGNRTAVTYDTT